MPSSLSWLDYTDEDQRRARELLRLFSETESRDELGIGSIRDALSEAMFPGISVIQTRARYFLFVPWLFVDGARRGRSGPELFNWVEAHERQLVERLRKGGDESGLIGRQVGQSVKTLPSTLYWSGLRRFEILLHSGTRTDVAAATRRRGRETEEGLTEIVELAGSPWASTLPTPPKMWPYGDSYDFVLSSTEASWLSERIGVAAKSTLLAHLVEVGAVPQGNFPWEDPAARDAPEAIMHILDQAERLSLAMNGAALLYNLQLAERCLELGITSDDSLILLYGDLLESWTAAIGEHPLSTGSWSLDDLWQATEQSPGVRIPPLTRTFVTEWLSTARSVNWKVTDSPAARRVVEQRERMHKLGQSRFTNERLLKQFRGGAGTTRLSFRWPQVKTIVTDIITGLERPDA